MYYLVFEKITVSCVGIEELHKAFMKYGADYKRKEKLSDFSYRFIYS